MGGRRFEILPWRDPCSIPIVCFSAAPDAYRNHTQWDAQHPARCRHAMPGGTKEKKPYLQSTLSECYMQRLKREWIGLLRSPLKICSLFPAGHK